MRRVQKSVSMFLALAMAASVVVLLPASPAAATHRCEEPGDDCDAYWWDNVFGTINLTGTTPGATITATITTGFPENAWVWTDSGYRASGVSAVSVSVPGTITAGSGPGWDDGAIGSSGVLFTSSNPGTEEPPWDPRSPSASPCGSSCPGAPGRFDDDTMTVTFVSNESGGQARASFGGNIGYLGWNDTAVRHIDGREPNRSPVADIVIVSPAGSATSESGIFSLRAGSTDPDGETLSHSWDLDDEQTDVGEEINVEYTRPGNYSVTLTSTDPQDASDTDSELLSVPSPTLYTEVSLPEGADGIAVGDEFAIDVVLGVRLDGVGEVGPITFPDGPLELPDFLEFVGDAPEFPSALVPGENRLRRATVRALEPGEGTLRSRPEGTDVNGDPALVLPGNIPIRVKALDLDVTISFDPDEVTIQHDDEGEPISKDVVVTVTIENPNTVTVPDVLAPDKLITGLVEGVDKYLEAGAVPDEATRTIGDLEAGESRALEYGLTITDDGIYSAEAVVQYSDPILGTTVANGEGEILAKPDKLLRYEISLTTLDGDEPTPSDNETVNAGQTEPAFVELENLSNLHELTLEDFRIEIEGAAGGGIPVLSENPLPMPGQCVVGGNRTVEPGDHLFLHAGIHTAPNHGTRAMLTLPIEGKATDHEATEARLRPADLVPVGADELRLSVLDPGIQPQPATVVGGIGNFTTGFVEGGAHWLSSTFAALSEIPALASAAGTSASEHLWAFVEDYHALPEDQRAAYVEGVAVKIANARDDTSVELVESIKQAFEGHMTQMFTAWNTGRVDEFWNMVGSDVAQGALELGMCEAAGAAFVTAAREARGSAFVARLSSSRIAQLASGTRIAIEAGRAFGYTSSMMRDIARFTEASGLRITFKPRDPDALVRIRDRNARSKPEPIKAKNVNDIDIDILGYPESSRATVALRPNLRSEIPNDTVLRSRMAAAGYGEEMFDAVKERLTQRLDELDKELPLYRSYEQGGMPTVFNYTDNGLDVPSGEVIGPNGRPIATLEDFQLVDAGDGLLEVQLRDGAGNWVPVTSDLDLLDIAKADGSALTMEERIAVYINLQRIADIQHPETATWLRDGTIDFAKKREILSEFANDASAPAMQAGPDGQFRAVRYDNNRDLTYFHSLADYNVHWKGGIRADAPVPWDRGVLEGYESLIRNTGRFVFIGGAWHVRNSDGELVPSEQSNASDSRTLRRADDGTVEEFTEVIVEGLQAQSATAGVWVPLAESEWADADVLRVLPQTQLTASAAAGTDQLSIIERAELERPLVEGRPFAEIDGFFGSGQTIVINPGGSNEEVAVVSGLGSLLLRSPLTQDHEAGELVMALTPPTEVGASVQFLDVPLGTWYTAGAQWASDQGITTGIGGGLFDPHGELDRAMLVTMVWRSAGSPLVDAAFPFVDADPDAYYAAALRWAYAEGIIRGTSPTTFDPHLTASRAHIVTVLWRWFGSPSSSAIGFIDVPPDRYFSTATVWASEAEVTTGIAPGEFGPHLTADRATLATMLFRLLG